jgi:hypothetical protein
MKRLLAATFAASLASGAMASVGFEFGAQFFFPRLDAQNAQEHWVGQGQSFAVLWDIDNALELGAYAESTNMADGEGGTANFTVQAVSVGREVVKNASVGLRIGTFTEDFTSPYGSGLLADVLGTITLVSGQGDRARGKLEASAGGRWADASTNNPNGTNWGGFFVNLAVSIGI